MQYNGPQSLPMIDMVLTVRWALEELGISVPWHDDGPLCELDVPRDGASVRIRREFSAETGRLFVTTTLKVPIPADEMDAVVGRSGLLTSPNGARVFVIQSGFLACSEVLGVPPNDVTPLFMGKLLDRTTKRILSIAESVGIVGKT